MPPTSLRFDEHLTRETLDREIVGVDLLYLSSHGGQGPRGYEVALATGEWPMALSRLGHGGPKVAVFDTCDLVDPTSPGWREFWRTGSFGPDLRLVLGFSTQATMSPETSRRGAAFAHLVLSGLPVAEAWLRAVTATGWPDLDIPVAIALGDNDLEARWIATEATIQNIPGPRQAQEIHIHVVPETIQR